MTSAEPICSEPPPAPGEGLEAIEEPDSQKRLSELGARPRVWSLQPSGKCLCPCHFSFAPAPSLGLSKKCYILVTAGKWEENEAELRLMDRLDMVREDQALQYSLQGHESNDLPYFHPAPPPIVLS